MDSVLLVFSVIDSAYLTAFENPEPAWYKALFPYFWHPFKNVATTCCAYMVVAIAAERYHAICRPLKYKPRTAHYSLIVIVLSILVNISKFFEFEHRSMASAKTQHQSESSGSTYSIDYWTTNLNEDAVYVVFSRYTECVLVTALPLVALCFLNYKIAVQIKKSANFKQRYICKGQRLQTRSSSSSLTVSQVTKRTLRLPSSCGEDEAEATVNTRTSKASNSHRRNSLGDSFLSSGTGSSLLILPAQSPSPLRTRSVNTPPQLRMHRNPLETIPSSPLTSDSTPVAAATNVPVNTRGGGRILVNQARNFRQKSTGILLCIIVVFFCCNLFRLCIQIYTIITPGHGLVGHFEECIQRMQLHVPAALHIMGNVNHLLLVLNSSVNFLIYCCLAKRFRIALVKMFKRERCGG